MQQDGCIASYGNAGGYELHTTVLPFILRGVRLLGVDSAATSMHLRQLIWQRLATDLHPKQLDKVVERVHFADLPQVFPRLMQSQLRGRVVVSMKAVV
jgi:NADPH2:quinone reductase